jgi:hypothetical protein
MGFGIWPTHGENAPVKEWASMDWTPKMEVVLISKRSLKSELFEPKRIKCHHEQTTRV